MEYSKSVLANMIWKAEDSDLEKAEYGRHKGKPVVQEEAHHGLRATSTHRGKEYQHDNDKGEINVHREVGTAPRKKLKTVSTDAAHEKELKNASRDDFDLEKSANKQEKDRTITQNPDEPAHRGKGKATWTSGFPGTSVQKEKKPYSEKHYDYDKDAGEVAAYPVDRKTAKKYPHQTKDEWSTYDTGGGTHKERRIPANAAHEKELKNASMDSLLNKGFENRRATPALFKSRDADELVDPHPYPKNFKNTKDPDKVEKYKEQEETKKRYPNPRGREKMERSYTYDEITVAQLLKGHPQAQEILDALNKGKNESGEEFQDGSEDTIGGEGHAKVARPDSIKHEGKPSGIGPNEPGTGTKKASVEDGDLEKSEDDEDDVEKSDNLADNLPEEFEDEMEEDDTIPSEGKNTKKSFTADEQTLSHLLKTMGPERFEEIFKAVIGGVTRTGYKMGENPKAPGSGVAGGATPDQKERASAEKENLRALTLKKFSTSKSEESDLEKSEENMGEGRYSLEFSKSVLEAMGLEKGATSVSKEAGGGKATQINYGSKPTTRFKHPKAKSDKKYIHNPAKGTVNVEKEGEKTREIGVGEQGKLKNASISSADLHKSLDAILEKKTVA